MGRQRKNVKAAGSDVNLISPEEAFTTMLALGGQVSIPELRQTLVRKHGDTATPTVKTLYHWSTQYNWKKRLEKLERLTEEEVQTYVVQDLAKARRQQIGLLASTSEKSMYMIAKTLAEADDRFMRQIKNTQDLKRLMDIVEQSTKLQELLEGRATSRNEGRTLQDDQDDEVLISRFRRKIAQADQEADQDDATGNDGRGSSGSQGSNNAPPGSTELH